MEKISEKMYRQWSFNVASNNAVSVSALVGCGAKSPSDW
jgi:hypothetical protein